MICIVRSHVLHWSMSHRKAESLLGSHPRRRKRSALARLLDQSSLREGLSAQLHALLPEDMREHCEVATVQGPLLTVLTPNAAWATRLRFMLPDLVPKLNQMADFGAVCDVQIRVAPHLNAVGQSMEAPMCTAAARPPDADALEQLAADLEYDELRSAILRLARHGRGRNGSHSPAREDGERSAGGDDQP
jgi:hypothetical protein